MDKIINDMNFEKEEGEITNYLTHNFHTYPAKFIPKIPYTTISALTLPGEVVLDPFCGCGTTIVESNLLGRKSIGIDLNPIATMVTKSKVTPLSEEQIFSIPQILESIKKDIDNYYEGRKTSNTPDIPNFHNREHWFEDNVLNELGIIKAYLNELEDGDLKNYLYTAFSSIIVSVSNQESDTRFAAINKGLEPKTTFSKFFKKVESMNPRILDFSKKSTSEQVDVYNKNSENLDFLEDNSIDHIVTSPPYANTYDYYLYHKFRIYWLGYDLERCRDNEIGSRNKHSSKKQDISTFEESLSKCMTEFGRVLKNGKYLVMVIGDSIIRGELHRADKLMEKVGNQNNFKLVRVVSYALGKNSRMFNPKFANNKKLEHIMFFKNGNE